MKALHNDSDLLQSFNLTYSPKLDVPREDAFEHIVKLALSRTDDRAVTKKEIVKILERTDDLPSLRHKIVNQSLKRLIKSGYVKPIDEKKEFRYSLKESERKRIKELAQTRGKLLRNCGETLTHQVEKVLPTLTRNQGEAIVLFFRKVIFDLFETFGYRCAQLVCEPSKRQPLMTSNDARNLMKKIALSLGLHNEQLYSKLEAEFISMMTGNLEPDLNTLFFELSQNYYILKLIGIDPQTSNLSKEVFRGYVAYLDSNIIINAILRTKRDYSYFEELISLVKGMGIQLKVTSVTVKEIKRVASYHKSICYAYGENFNDIPEEFKNQIDDDFYLAYIENKKLNPAYSLEDLFASFEELDQILVDKFGIEIEDSELHKEILKQEGRVKGIGQVVHDMALELKRRHKSDRSCRHDAFIYLLINELRNRDSPKTLHLTLDKTLPFVADRLQKGSQAQAYCFTLDVWLQTLSPFISQKAETDFARIFVQSFTSDLFAFGQMFRFDAIVLLKQIGISLNKHPPDVRRELVTLIASEFERAQIFDPETRKQVRYRIDTFLARIKEEAAEIRKQENAKELSKEQLRELWRKEVAKGNRLKERIEHLRASNKANRLSKINRLRKRKKKGLTLRIAFGVLLFLGALVVFTLPWLTAKQILAPGWRQIVIPIGGILAGVLLISSKKLKQFLKKGILKKIGKIFLIVLEIIAGAATIVDILLRLIANR